MESCFKRYVGQRWMEMGGKGDTTQMNYRIEGLVDGERAGKR